MLDSGEKILADIDKTLDQLIKNAVALRQIAEVEAFTPDCAVLHKVQHSLTGRLMHMQDLLKMLGAENPEEIHDSIREKISEYKRLNNTMIDVIAQRFNLQPGRIVRKKPRIGHNRRRAPVRVVI